jgi:2-dehydropantoate 2-reductase
MRFVIFGTGGAGGFFGAHLARAGEDTVFIARGRQLQAIRERGLRVETSTEEIVIHPAQATDNPQQVGKADVVLVGVKTWQVPDAARAIQPMIAPQTLVIPLQNGVEAASQLAAALGASHVLGGLCATFSWVESAGYIRNVGGANFIKFGELDNQPSERTERLRQAFVRAGVTAIIPPDIRVALWEKFLFVVPNGGVGAVTRAPIGVIRALPETRRMIESCMEEIFAVARAHQIALADGSIEKTLAFLDSLAPGGTTSLQRDIAAGKPSELDAWNGAVVRLGAEAGMATPGNRFIYDSLLPSELQARGQLQFPSTA